MTDAPSEASGDPSPVVTDEALLARFQNARSRPPASETMGFSCCGWIRRIRRSRSRSRAARRFTNPAGQIQGGFLCAMLDETMSVAGVVASNMTAFMPTLEMKTSFLRPALPGRLICVGRVVKWGKAIAFLEGELYDDQRRLLAKATSTAMPQPFKSIKRPGV